MAFTGQENHNISLADAAAWTKNYRKANPNAVQGHFFGKDAIAAILAQDSCVGMRIYYALDTAGVKQLIITGVTAEENDLYNGLLAERSIQCPPTCGGGNPLNS
jgi:hypothetical protein